MPKRPRPQILADQFMQSTVLGMIAAGASRAAAARFVGVHVQTLCRRIRTDKAFAQRFLEAKAHYHGYITGKPQASPSPRPRGPTPAASAATPETAAAPTANDLFKQRLVQLLHRAIDAFHRSQRRIPEEVLQSLTSTRPDILPPFPFTSPRIPHPPNSRPRLT